jgi:hypothetical protein
LLLVLQAKFTMWMLDITKLECQILKTLPKI